MLKQRRRVGVVITALLLGLLAAMGIGTPAQAATVKAGCTNKHIHQSYYVYHYDMYVWWCWTAGTTATSKIYSVHGYSDAGGSTATLNVYQTQKEFGPTHSDHTAFDKSEKFTAKVAAYGGFQSAACLVLQGVCIHWVWHKDIAVLLPSGKYTWDAN